MNLDKRYLIWALGFAAVGLALGIYMAASHNHAELVAHAHILLIGFVLSFVYGIIHRLWLEKPSRAVANIQFVLHQAAAITVSVGLFLLYGGFVPESKLDPVLTCPVVSSEGTLFSRASTKELSREKEA
ncbi:MAG: TonB-dependent receptor [Proteobacteria bacterium]|nr:TonB-dependent receptor [Pseudomonadota bacterium]